MEEGRQTLEGFEVQREVRFVFFFKKTLVPSQVHSMTHCEVGGSQGMGRSRGVLQGPPSDLSVVHLLENRRSKQMFENVAKNIRFSSVNPPSHLRHWNQHQISGEHDFHSPSLRKCHIGV